MSEHLRPETPEQTSETPISRLVTDSVRSEIHTLLDDAEVKRYDTEPLPFSAVVESAREHLTWKDFDQDQSGEYVYLYRGIGGMDIEEARESAHATDAARYKKTPEDVFKYYGTTNIAEICAHATNNVHPAGEKLHPWPGNPILHTSRRRYIANGFGREGVLITYKIPKRWLIQASNYPIQGNQGEQELDFFMGIPVEFVDDIEQKREKQEPVPLRAPKISEHTGPDVIQLNVTPPPSFAPAQPHLPSRYFARFLLFVARLLRLFCTSDLLLFFGPQPS
jgi:hypothetical protein